MSLKALKSFKLKGLFTIQTRGISQNVIEFNKVDKVHVFFIIG